MGSSFFICMKAHGDLLAVVISNNYLIKLVIKKKNSCFYKKREGKFIM